MTDKPMCLCGHTKDKHERGFKGCMFVASIPSRAKKRYGGKGRNRHIQCDCRKFRPMEES